MEKTNKEQKKKTKTKKKRTFISINANKDIYKKKKNEQQIGLIT